MPYLARCCALLLPLLASPAAAQADRFRLSPGHADYAPGNGFVAAASLGERVRFGLGRFGVADRPRLRTHVEPVPPPTDVRRRHRGTAAIGFSVSF